MKKKSRILAALLTVCLVITLMPVISFAAESAGAAGPNNNIVVLYSGDINGGVDANIGLAGMADRVVEVVVGIPVTIKGERQCQ